MHIGVVVTDDKYVSDAVALLGAASSKGFETECFLTDRGILLLNFNNFTDFVDKIDCKVSICEYSMDRLGETKNIEKFKDRMVIGGQYQDAELVSRSDKVVVF
ncbi:MAG: DsrE family protein [Deltaproteobacteria bacterium]|nr:DsrE family protein [Deltaproteobacteria bacterium]